MNNQNLYKSLNAQLSQRENELLKKIANVDKYSQAEINSLVGVYKSEITALIEKSCNLALLNAKDSKIVQYTKYLNQCKQIAKKYEIAPKVFELKNIVPIFGGGMDKTLLEKVWNKAYPDNLNVDDRIDKLGKSIKDKVELYLKQGISNGTSSRDIAKEIADNLNIERNSAIRLAVSTTNTMYNTAQAEISIQAIFVIGIKITRDADGSEKCDVCAEHGGEVGGDGIEYYKTDFGGDDYDLYVIANAPTYHNNCKCSVEDIIESAEQFVQRARNEYKNK